MADPVLPEPVNHGRDYETVPSSSIEKSQSREHWMRLLTHHWPWHMWIAIQILSTSMISTSLSPVLPTPQPSCNLGFAVSRVRTILGAQSLCANCHLWVPSSEHQYHHIRHIWTYIYPDYENRVITLDTVCRTRSLKDIDTVIAPDSKHHSPLIQLHLFTSPK